MKKIIVSGLCALCLTPAIADDFQVRPYVGGNLNVDFVSYSASAKDIADYYGLNLPGVYFGLGLEGGVKFGNQKHIWNGGLAIAYDYLFDNSITSNNSYIDPDDMDAKLGFSAWHIDFDNYIRIANEQNQRTDLIFGLGIGQATERLNIDVPGYISLKQSDDGGIFMLKFGTDIQLNKTIGWYTTLRIFIPTKDGDISSIVSTQTGLKFVF